MKKWINIFLLFFTLAFTGYSQDSVAIYIPKSIPQITPTLKAGFRLPNALSNNAYKKVFEGIANIDLSIQQPIFKGFFIAGGIQGQYFDINKFSFPEVSNGDMLTASAFAGIGFEKYISPRLCLSFSERIGYNYYRIKSDNCIAAGEGNTTGGSLFNETTAGAYLVGNERMLYGLILSHQLYHFEFGPEMLCRTNFSGLTEVDYTGLSHVFTIGFGFSVILGKI